MASGYGTNLGRSETTGSDTIFDHQCSPCSDEGKNTEAVNQCVDCQILYCHGCIAGHNKFTKDHRVIDNGSTMFGQVQRKQVRQFSASLPSDVCDEHHREVIKMFCKEHGVVCCAVCVAIKHRSCGDVKYIPAIAEGIHQRKDRVFLKSSLKRVVKDLENLIDELLEEHHSLDMTGIDIVEEIRGFTGCIIDRVKKLEMAALQELHEHHKELSDNIRTYGSNIEDILNDVNIRLTKLSRGHAEHVNEAQLFVDINYGKKESRRAKECVKTSADRDVTSIYFDWKQEIINALRDKQSFGKTTVIRQPLSEAKKAAEIVSDARRIKNAGKEEDELPLGKGIQSSNAMKSMGIQDQVVNDDFDDLDEREWRDEDTLRRLEDTRRYSQLPRTQTSSPENDSGRSNTPTSAGSRESPESSSYDSESA